MRTLEQIQADISFLLHEKESFFSKLFHSNSQRIKDLRIDEKKAIDIHLYTNDDRYKALSDENASLLRNTHWKLKILDYRDTDRDLQYSNHIAALIEMKGFLHGKGQTGVFFRRKEMNLTAISIRWENFNYIMQSNCSYNVTFLNYLNATPNIMVRLVWRKQSRSFTFFLTALLLRMLSEIRLTEIRPNAIPFCVTD